MKVLIILALAALAHGFAFRPLPKVEPDFEDPKHDIGKGLSKADEPKEKTDGAVSAVLVHEVVPGETKERARPVGYQRGKRSFGFKKLHVPGVEDIEDVAKDTKQQVHEVSDLKEEVDQYKGKGQEAVVQVAPVVAGIRRTKRGFGLQKLHVPSVEDIEDVDKDTEHQIQEVSDSKGDDKQHKGAYQGRVVHVASVVAGVHRTKRGFEFNKLHVPTLDDIKDVVEDTENQVLEVSKSKEDVDQYKGKAHEAVVGVAPVVAGIRRSKRGFGFRKLDVPTEDDIKDVDQDTHQHVREDRDSKEDVDQYKGKAQEAVVHVAPVVAGIRRSKRGFGFHKLDVPKEDDFKDVDQHTQHQVLGTNNGKSNVEHQDGGNQGKVGHVVPIAAGRGYRREKRGFRFRKLPPIPDMRAAVQGAKDKLPPASQMKSVSNDFRKRARTLASKVEGKMQANSAKVSNFLSRAKEQLKEKVPRQAIHAVRDFARKVAEKAQAIRS